MEIVKEKVKYDPSKHYTWTPDTMFVITGEQFGVILNTVRNVISTPEAAKIIAAIEANKQLEAVIATAVENEDVVELKQKENEK